MVDVFVLGPFMVWAAGRTQMPPWARLALGVAGAATIYYNAVNYREFAEHGERRARPGG